MPSFHTEQDVLRRTILQSFIGVVVSASASLLISLVEFGVDPARQISAGHAVAASLTAAVLVSTLVGSILSYRASRTLQKLALIRAELWRLSRTDQLTGLLNRRGFCEAAADSLERAQREGVQAVAFMCDVDHFKSINDRFGHEFGDVVLAEIGRLLSTHAKGNGMIVGRLGGEEFAALLLGTDTETAMQTAERIRQACAAAEILHEGAPIRVTISIGLVCSEQQPLLERMLRCADRALYEAKAAGRNRVVLAEVSHNLAATTELAKAAA
jgi:diguanylate cyclase (GGDEF)-like protein